jgi:hypothetical protein
MCIIILDMFKIFHSFASEELKNGHSNIASCQEFTSTLAVESAPPEV